MAGIRLESNAATVKVANIPLLGTLFSSCTPIVEENANASRAAAVEDTEDV
jgi:hypothetical protein